MNETRPIRILLVEDNERDVRLTKETFADAGLTNELVVAPDGEAALELLGLSPFESGMQSTSKADFDLIIVDLNLPVLDGREVIEILRQDMHLRETPVIILTNSLDDRALTVNHMLDAKTYLEKPIDILKLYEGLQAYPQFRMTIGRAE